MEIQIQLVVQPCGSDWETPASPGKMIYSHHPQSLLTVLTTPDFFPPEIQKKTFYCHKSGVGQLGGSIYLPKKGKNVHE